MKRLYLRILRDYFAAHAPEKPQDWAPSSVTIIPPRPEPPAVIKDAAEQWLDDPCYDFAVCFKEHEGQDPEELEFWPPKYRPLAERFEAEMNEWWEFKRKANLADDRANFIAWRWAYADAMIAERGRKG